MTDDFELSIAKEAVAKLPVVTYPGEITIINSRVDAEKALRFLSTLPIVGLDTETRPNFRRGHLNKVALVQIYAPSRCFLFRINQFGLIPQMVEFLESESTIKVGLSLQDDFRNLNKISRFEPKAYIDLQQYVNSFHIRDNSLQRIYAIIFGKRISKSQRLTNWEADKLTERQQIYASIDAWACFQLYQHLSKGLFHPEKSPYRAIPDPDNAST